jgi:hypothetical protein
MNLFDVLFELITLGFRAKRKPWDGHPRENEMMRETSHFRWGGWWVMMGAAFLVSMLVSLLILVFDS